MSSLLPGLWDGISNAFSGAVDTVKDWFGSGSKEEPPIQIEQIDKVPPASTNPPPSTGVPQPSLDPSDHTSSASSESAKDPAAIDGPKKESGDWRKWSLFTLFNLLRLEAISGAEKKAKASYTKLNNTHATSGKLTSVLEHITTFTDKKTGIYELKDEGIKGLLRELKAEGTAIEIKDKYTKDDRDALVRSLELRGRKVDTDLKLFVNETQEALQVRNSFYQELKSCWDKIVETVRKLIQAIVAR